MSNNDKPVSILDKGTYQCTVQTIRTDMSCFIIPSQFINTRVPFHGPRRYNFHKHSFCGRNRLRGVDIISEYLIVIRVKMKNLYNYIN